MFTNFRSAGAAGHVFLIKGGKVVDKGLAYSGFIGPWTTVAVVPTTIQAISFSVDAQTADRQQVSVIGTVSAAFIPAVAVTRFDFTVNPKNGSFIGEWQRVLNDIVIERVVRAVLGVVEGLTVIQAVSSQLVIEQAVTAALGDNALAGEGVTIKSCSVPRVEPDDEVGRAIGASERQAVLTQADKALSVRRIEAAGNERQLKKYEADTAFQLEENRARLIGQQVENDKAKAAGEAAATEMRMKPLRDLEPATLLGAALLEGMKGGHKGTLVVAPELLAALQQLRS